MVPPFQPGTRDVVIGLVPDVVQLLGAGTGSCARLVPNLAPLPGTRSGLAPGLAPGWRRGGARVGARLAPE